VRVPRDRSDPLADGRRVSPFARSAKYLQANVRSAGSAMIASYTLIGSILLLGGIGFVADRWLGTSPWCLLIGLLIGMIVGFYELARAVWRR
jgi:ATP synthase protein I